MLGAVIESVLNTTYESAINQMFVDMGLNSTFCKSRVRRIKSRTRYYVRSDSPYLTNSSSNSSSLKVMPALLADDIWSANSWLTSAGVVSTASDLLRFGNYMIDSFKENSTVDYGLSYHEFVINL